MAPPKPNYWSFSILRVKSSWVIMRVLNSLMYLVLLLDCGSHETARLVLFYLSEQICLVSCIKWRDWER